MYKTSTIFSESRYCLYCIFRRITVSCNCHRTHVSVKSIVRWAQQPRLCFHWLNVWAIGGFGASDLIGARCYIGAGHYISAGCYICAGCYIGARHCIGAGNCPFHPIPGQPCPVHPQSATSPLGPLSLSPISPHNQ